MVDVIQRNTAFSLLKITNGPKIFQDTGYRFYRVLFIMYKASL